MLSSMRIPKISAWVILPLRLFLGCSFLAGFFDKITDPTYLEPSAPSYIGAQIAAFASGTPLEGFLLNFAVPNATLFGVLVMGGELCIGIAVLLGLLTRFSAAMGLLLNLTFYLSATWNVHPFFLGSDLPYAFGWLTLLLAGPGLLALDHRLKEWWAPAPIAYVRRGRTLKVAATASTVDCARTAMTRRAFLGAGGMGLVALTMASAGIGWGALNSNKKSTSASGLLAKLQPSSHGGSHACPTEPSIRYGRRDGQYNAPAAAYGVSRHQAPEDRGAQRCAGEPIAKLRFAHGRACCAGPQRFRLQRLRCNLHA